MCGIWTLINKNSNEDVKKYLADYWNLMHRGPDNSQLHAFNNTYVGFHRLSIMDNSYNSNQPYIFQHNNKMIVFICNGEIYNFRELDTKYNLNIGSSDCKVIPTLYMKLGKIHWLELFKNEIKGEFAFIMLEFDNLSNLLYYYVGRDMIGVRPLYCVEMNYDIDMYSSELKGMLSYENKVSEFTPGTIRCVQVNPSYVNSAYLTTFDFTTIYDTVINDLSENNNLLCIKNSVINSVKRRLYSDRPIAFLLSGGVDSSLVAALSMKILGYPIHTFCCGMKNSTDMLHAKMVAEHIGSIHTEVYFTEEEGLELIDDVIRTTETWDTTTIRASIGQYIVSRYIKNNTDFRVVLVGEGPDEVCSSYLFNYYAPNATELHKAALQYVKEIHMYDGKRADRCIARWGMEARIPLLDPEFITTYWGIDPKYRLPTYNMEKYLLRKAFDNDNLLPNKVLWRKKEAFSDGVSGIERSWFSVIQEYTSKKMLNIVNPFTLSDEASYYKLQFRKYFGNNRDDIIPHYWQPKWDKDGNEITSYVDPSARTLAIYS